MSKQETNSIIEPTEEELIAYKQVIADISEEQMDELASQYFEEVNEGLNISFPKYLIDKFIRPIQPGDTINIQTEERKTVFLFCLVREEIEGVTYLIFAEANGETEELNAETIYLFYICGLDDIGMEIIDIMPAGEETEKILDLLEAKSDVELANRENSKTDKQE